MAAGAGAGAGVRRSRANPFKSTQLRQWGFICYLGGHIVSRRERTDRLRRASDGAGPREPAPIPTTLAPRERLYPVPRSLLAPFRAHPFHVFPLLFYERRRVALLIADVAAIRQKSGFAVTRPRRNFPRIARTPLPLPLFLSRPFTPTDLALIFFLFQKFCDGKICPFVRIFVRQQVKRERDEYRARKFINFDI